MDNPALLENKASALRNQGKGHEAIAAYQQVKQAYLAAGDLARAAGMQHMIGVCYKVENDIDKALSAYDQAVADYKKADDALGQARVERDYGIMLEYYDRFDDAEEHLLKSKTELQALPSDQATKQSTHEQVSRDAELGITLAKIGLLYTRMQKLAEAEPLLMQSLVLIRGVGHPFYEMTALLHLAELYFATGHYGRMLANLQAGLGLIYEHAMQADQTRRLAQIWGLMAHGYLQHGNKVSAVHFAKKALDVINGLSANAQKSLRKDIRANELEELLKK